MYGAVAGAGGAVGLILGGVLTQYLSWRWCLYVNVFFAAAAGAGAVMGLKDRPTKQGCRLDCLGPSSRRRPCSAFYGFANVGKESWSAVGTWVPLPLGGLLLAGFVLWQTKATAPLLPSRILGNLNRGGAYLSMLASGAGMSGLMLFMNFLLQQKWRYSPLQTGLAFLPMVVLTMSFNGLSSVRLMPRFGPRPLVTAGMLAAAAAGSLYLAWSNSRSDYLTGVLPAMLLAGVGLGLIFAPVAATGTTGVALNDIGAASATVNASGQLGGSIGTALLNRLFASAVANLFTSHSTDPGAWASGHPSPALTDAALTHGYTIAFTWTAVVYAAGALIAVTLFRSGPLPHSEPHAHADHADAQPARE